MFNNNCTECGAFDDCNCGMEHAEDCACADCEAYRDREALEPTDRTVGGVCA